MIDQEQINALREEGALWLTDTLSIVDLVLLLLTADELITKKESAKAASLSVFKDATGHYRWVLLSSNGYRDRDGEIVSTKALTNDVARADADKDYGPLRWWHVPGADIGDCDYNAMSGRVLVESGTFRSEAIGRAVHKAQANLQASIGFRHPTSEPDGENVYHHIRRFERSLTPLGRASNPFTRLIVQGGKMEEDKIKALKALIGEEAVNGIIAQVQATQKEADSQGVAYKEATGTSGGTGSLTLTANDVARFVTEPVAVKAEGEAMAEGEEEEEEVDERIYAGDLEPGELVSMIATAVKEAIAPLVNAMDMTTKMSAMVEELKGLMGATSKSDEIALLQEQQARKDQESAQLKAAVESKMSALETQLNAARTELAELTGEQPRAVKGYRASQAPDTIVGDAHALKAQKPEGPDPNFIPFLIGRNEALPPQ
jgi:hypothetical protein